MVARLKKHREEEVSQRSNTKGLVGGRVRLGYETTRLGKERKKD